MDQGRTSLESAFLADQQVLTRGFDELLRALETDDLDLAVQVAGRLDREAGSHVEFEEEVLYPLAAGARGGVEAESLVHEHGLALEAISRLSAMAAGDELTSQLRRWLIERVQIGRDHAVRFGSLSSHLTTLDDIRKRELLERFETYRKRGRSWREYASSSMDDFLKSE